MSKMDAARRLLSACELVYGGAPTKEKDFASISNTVGTYADLNNQKKYVHMYFARYVGCWRAIRRKTQVGSPYNLVSIGAGPLLCCAGWHWDAAAPVDGNTVKPYDVLDWRGVLQLPEFDAFLREQFTVPPHYSTPRYMPDGPIPPQVASIPEAKPISAAEIGPGNIVLLPFVLNHLVGFTGPVSVGEQRRVFDWIEQVRRAGNLVFIADMFYRGDTAPFWDLVTTELGAPRGNNGVNFNFAADAAALAPAYATPGQGNRRAGLSADATKAGVLFSNAAGGWAWLV